jgi:hypothetical protein
MQVGVDTKRDLESTFFANIFYLLTQKKNNKFSAKFLSKYFFVFDGIDVSAFGEHSVFTFHHKNARELIWFDSFIFQKGAVVSFALQLQMQFVHLA